MLVSLWRQRRRLPYRPQIEVLEGRALPALGGSMLVGLAPVAPAFGVLQQTGSSVPAGITPLHVTVSQNASETVLDLGPVFAARPGLQHQAGLHLAVLGNTNARLVTPDLSGSALTLTYTRGLSGTATITVNATDADGVCAQQTVVVTVLPLRPVLGVEGVSPIAPPKPPMPGGSAG